MARWTPSLHPRDRNGRFASKGSIGFRVSTRSVSATAGRRFPIVPGKVNLYVGALVRVENASRSKGPIDKLTDKVQDRLVNAIPEGATRNIIKNLAGSGSHREGSTLISGTTGRRSTPTIRVTRSSAPGGGSNSRNTGSVQTSGVSRSPNRKPRAPRANRPVVTPEQTAANQAIYDSVIADARKSVAVRSNSKAGKKVSK